MKKCIFLFVLFFALIQDVNLESKYFGFVTESVSPIKITESVSSISLKTKEIKKFEMPTESQLFDTLKSKGFIDPVAVWRIAIWESGHMRSEICRTRNNLFGLKTRDYIYFASWLDCIDYMKKMEDIRWAQYSTANSGDYYDFIHWCGYKTGRSRSDEDLQYTKTLKTLDPPKSL